MAYEHLRKEIAKLGESVPGGYETYNSDGQPVIQSAMDGLDWYMWATTVLREGKPAEKEKLRAQLAASTGADSGGGCVYQLVAACDYEAIEAAPGGPNSAPGPTETRA